MCYPAAPPPQVTEVEVSKKRWGSGMVKALRELQWKKTIRNNGRKLGQHIRSVTGGTSQKVRRVRRWVFNITFAKVFVPLFFLGFVLLLHPHTEIQLGVTAGLFTFFFCFFISTNEDPIEEDVFLDKTSLNTKKLLEKDDRILPPVLLPLQLYSLLPLNLISRLWGMLADKELPQPFDYFSVWLFAKAAHCRRDEAEFDDLSCYKTVSQFFTRKLKPGVRQICAESNLVSPADGTETYSGVVKGSYLEQVKGVQYSLREFLGSLDDLKELPRNVDKGNLESLEEIDQKVGNSISPYSQLLQSQTKSATCLYQTVIYLSPSDYHRFHSPASWTVIKRRHFPGKLYSVAPSLVRKIPGLFHINERVAFIGRWDYGFFAMVAVGATNVGSIKVHFDEELKTNTTASCKSVSEKVYETPIEFEKGDEFGYFNFGSTIVLIYEAPAGIAFDNEHMKKVKMGERMWMEEL